MKDGSDFTCPSEIMDQTVRDVSAKTDSSVMSITGYSVAFAGHPREVAEDFTSSYVIWGR